jgi:NitT/TauT family transport system substrate-binding protein
LIRWFGALVALGLTAGHANAQERVTLQLKWVTQAQFAGYYAAQARGFYRRADLDVRIIPGGPDIAPPQAVAGGGADVIVEWMPAALASRERGVPLVNIAQPFRRSGLMLTCRAETGIRTPADLRGRTLGVWFSGNEYPFLAWMAHLGYRTDGSPQGVRVLRQGSDVAPLLQRQADCISAMTYNGRWCINRGPWLRQSPSRGLLSTPQEIGGAAPQSNWSAVPSARIMLGQQLLGLRRPRVGW